MKNLLIVTFLSLALIAPTQAAVKTYQNHAFIKQQAKQFIKDNSASLDGTITSKINNIDHRIKLIKCSDTLSVKTTRGQLQAGKNTLSISCNAKPNWRIFLTSHIGISKNIYVANKQLKKGAVISNSDVSLKRLNITTHHRRYYTDKSSIIGHVVKRTINSGDVFAVNNLTKQLLIKKGDQITIIATSNGFEISMKGIALASGSEGQRINVKNIRTKRIIQGIVDINSTVKVHI